MAGLLDPPEGRRSLEIDFRRAALAFLPKRILQDEEGFRRELAPHGEAPVVNNLRPATKKPSDGTRPAKGVDHFVCRSEVPFSHAFISITRSV